MAPQGQLGPRVSEGRKGMPDNRARLEKTEHQVLQVPSVKLEQLAPRDLMVTPALQDRQGPTDNQERLGPRGLLARRVRWAQMGALELRVSLVLRALLEVLDLLGLQGNQVRRVVRDRMVKWDPKER